MAQLGREIATRPVMVPVTQPTQVPRPFTTREPGIAPAPLEAPVQTPTQVPVEAPVAVPA
jgi:hypothetical protein